MESTQRKPRRTTPKMEMLRAAAANPDVALGAVEAAALAGTSRSSLYRMVKEGRAPAPDIRLNARVVRWRARTIVSWLDGLGANPAGS